MYKSTSRSIQHGREQDAKVRHDSPGSPRRSMRGKDVQRLQLARQRNEVLTGSVSRVEASGAFVTLGTLEGFVSRHEVTERRVGDVRTVLRPGMTVKVRILMLGQAGKGMLLTMKNCA
jgi:ribosomal protein S1